MKKIIISQIIAKYLRNIARMTFFAISLLVAEFSYSQESQEPCGPQFTCYGESIPDLSIACTCTGGLPVLSGPGVTTANNVIYSFNLNELMLPSTYVLNADCPPGDVDYSFTVTVQPAINATINGSSNPAQINVCGGISTNLLANATGGNDPYTYSWSPSTGLNNPNIANPIATPTSTTTYTLTVTDDNGCIDIVSITINVTSYALNITASDETICLGQSTYLTFSGGIVGQYQVQYSTGGYSNPPGINLSPNPIETTTYTLSLNGTNCETTDQVTVQVFPQPTITSTGTPSTNSLCNGSVTATALYSGNMANLVYSWTLNGVLIAGANTASIINCCAGTYVCTVTGLNGCFASTTFVVQNIITPAYDIVVSNDICNAGCGGTATVTSETPFTVQWNAPLTGSTTTIEGVCSGNYTVTITFEGNAPFNALFSIVEQSGTPLGPINTNYPILGQTVIAQGNVVINNGGILGLTNSTLIVYGDILIEAGGKLDLFNSTIKMQTDKKIIVKQRGYLESEIGTFTSACANEFWRGIEVWGTATLSQTAANQGRVDLQKTTIVEKAHVGLRFAKSNSANSEQGGTGGGYGNVAETMFKNNRRDVQFIKYPTTGTNDNISSFKACSFLTDANAGYTTNTMRTMKSRIQMSQVNSVDFLGCTVRNTHPGWLDIFTTVTGVEANQSPFIFTATTFQGTNYVPRVEGLITGMRLNNSFFGTPHKVKDVVFRCYRGMQCTSIGNSTIIEDNSFYALASNSGFPDVPVSYLDTWLIGYINDINTLSDYNSKNSYCIYVSSPVGIIKVVDNYFNLQGPANVYRVGLYVHQNQGNINDIAGNYFKDMTQGCFFYNANRNDAQQGLQFSCNIFEDNFQDVTITKKPGTLVATTLFGIKPVIGNTQLHISQGNNFGLSNSIVEQDDLKNGPGMQTHTYVYDAGELVLNEVSSTMNPITWGDASSIDCSPYDYQGSMMPEIEDKLFEHEALRALYDEMIDGGNTAQTLTDIELADYEAAFELYNDLMQKSPALSREVMIEAIQKETELPMALLTAILASNPSAAKDPLIQEELDKRSVQLTTYQRALIDQGLYILSSKENMEAHMADVMAEYGQLLAYEYNLIANDPNVTDKLTAWDNLMSMSSDPYGTWVRVNWLASQARYSEAHVLGTQAVNELRPMSDCRPDWSNYLDLLNILQTVAAQSAPQLSASQVQQMLNYMDVSQPATYGLALHALMAYSDYEHHEPTSYPESEQGLRRARVNNDMGIEGVAWISLYPNPAKEYFSIRLTNAPITTAALYTISDLTGRIVLEGKLASNNFEYIVDVSKLNTGVYTLSIFDQDQLIQAEKIAKE